MTVEGLQHLSGLTALQYLDLHGCDRMTDTGLEHLRSLTTLFYLGLANVLGGQKRMPDR